MTTTITVINEDEGDLKCPKSPCPSVCSTAVPSLDGEKSSLLFSPQSSYAEPQAAITAEIEALFELVNLEGELEQDCDLVLHSTDSEPASQTPKEQECSPVNRDRRNSLDIAEENITWQVPELLDTMNHASDEANTLEIRATRAERRYKAQLEHCQELYIALRAKAGRKFDKVKPYVFATQEVKAASLRTQRLARQFSEAAAAYESASKGSRRSRLVGGYNDDEMASLKAKCDDLEREYATSLHSHQSANKSLESRRSALGDDMIHEVTPLFEALQEEQMKLTIELNRINTAVECHRAARRTYKNSMHELENISEAVHECRRDYAARRAKREAAVQQS